MFNEDVFDRILKKFSEKELDDYNEETKRKYDWRKYKRLSLHLADSYRRLKIKNYVNVSQCTSYLVFKYFLDTNQKKLHMTNFCRDRLCPMCSKRRSLKIFGQMSKVMDFLEKEKDYKYIFLTLTQRNVIGSELDAEIDKLMSAFVNLMRRRKIKNVVKGYYRALEITHNYARNDYHPHFHVVLAVDKSYHIASNDYINQAEFVELWADCLKVDYLPSVDVRFIKNNDEKNKKYKSIAEIAKYTVKSSDYLYFDEYDKRKVEEEITDEVVYYLHYALKNRRLVGMGGCFKEAHSLLNLQNLNDDNINLIETDNEEIRNDLSYLLLKFDWNIGYKTYMFKEILKNEK